MFGIFVFTGILPIFGQQGKNIPNFEYRKWHFGTMLGVNTSSFNYQVNPNFSDGDSITNISLSRRPGFGIHVPVASWNIHSTIHLRFTPSISFHETLFTYSYQDKGEIYSTETRTEPTNLNFPLMLKFSTKRLNNFSAYASGGFGYSLDLASQHDVEQTSIAPIIKLKQHDWQYHIGGGFDFYLPYFKLGIDIKTAQGVTNLLIQDDTFFAAPLQYLKTNYWWFSITFEG